MLNKVIELIGYELHAAVRTLTSINGRVTLVSEQHTDHIIVAILSLDLALVFILFAKEGAELKFCNPPLVQVVA